MIITLFKELSIIQERKDEAKIIFRITVHYLRIRGLKI